METYQKKVRVKMFILALIALTAVALGIYNVFFEGESVDSDVAAGILSGFRSGLSVGLGVVSLIRMIILGQAIRDEKKLKELYNKEHDERLREIRAKAGMPLLLITSFLMLVAAMIAGPLNVTIFFTLLIAAMAQLLTGLVVKMYYLKKM